MYNVLFILYNLHFTQDLNSHLRPGFSVRASVSQHQGGRAYMEDFSSVTVDADNQEACFAVYDGHGGHDAAYFCQRNLWHNIR